MSDKETSSVPEAYILDRAARIGDRVYYQQSKDNSHYRNPDVPNGTKGTVVGFERYTDYVGRNEAWLSKNDFTVGDEGVPGKYERNGPMIVLWDGIGYVKTSAHDVYPENFETKEARYKDELYNKAFETKVRVADLPELPYWEGDIVTTSVPIFGDGNGCLAKIVAIDYRNIDEKCSDGVTLMPIYRIESVEGRSGTTTLNDLVREPSCVGDEGPRWAITGLSCRGLYWTYYNDRENLKFKNIQEETAFWHSLGFAVQVINPESSHYGWTIRQAVQALKEKKVASVKMSPGFFGAKATPAVYNFPLLPEFEERVRSHFNIQEFEEAFAQGKFQDEPEEQV